MELSRRITLLCALLSAAMLVVACAPATDTNTNTTNTTANTNASPAASPSPATQTLAPAERPQKIKDMMAQRDKQDDAKPVLKITQPAEGSTVNGSTVKVKLTLGGELKGYKPVKDPATGMGNHIHVILDNQPYEAYYNLDAPFELRNVGEGQHTLRVFASRPWHESYKNDGSFQLVSFTVKGGGDPSKPTTTATGEKMADNKNAPATANTNAATTTATPAATPEGKDMAASTGGGVDRKKPLLTYSRPKGEYKGDDTNAIMIDFWLSNAKLQGDGGDYRVRYSVDGGEAKFLDKWEPIWLTGWTAGKHTVKLELVDKDGNPFDNGGYNTTSREVTITK
ncbi:MAG: hypothetical protein LC754_06035 [Acidobacteria bacterium]|nr:hypothetical protein [Acidobacteriota bacterium]